MSILARLYQAYRDNWPGHRGKARVVRFLEGRLVARQRPFAWRMRNGSRVAIRPDEAVRNYGVAAVCFRDRQWEPHVEAVLRRVLKPGHCALDVGANIGVFTAAMAQAIGPSGRVYAFEPVSRTFEQLVMTTRMSRLENVSCIKSAVGACPGTVEIHVPADVSGNASAYRRQTSSVISTEQVAVTTLDEQVAVRAIRDVSVIKIDVEGGELEVLRGARQLIRRCRPRLLVEINPETARAAGWTVSDFQECLAECGEYRPWVIVGDGKLVSVPLADVEFEPGAYIDVFLAPVIS